MEAQTKDTEDMNVEKPQRRMVRGNNYLVLIAIDTYEKKPLHNCVKDAEDIRNLLQKKYFFQKKYTTCFYNEKATFGNLLSYFEGLIDQIVSKDNLIIYFSGHGVFDKKWESFEWETIESEKEDKSKRFPHSRIQKVLNVIKARHVFLMADSCFSGTMFDIDNKKGSIEVSPGEEYDSRRGLSSGRNELVSEGELGKNSPFAEALIEILNKNTESLGVIDLGERVTARVILKTNKEQKPRSDLLISNRHEGGQFYFHLRQSKVKVSSAAPLVAIDLLSHIPISSNIGFPEAPYKGLKFFTEQDAKIFFGRNREIRDVYQILEAGIEQRSRLVLLSGQAGIGKSSFLSAGLLSRLPEHWLVRYKRRSEEPNSLEIFDQFVHEVKASQCSKAILIIDQLEEIVNQQGEAIAQEQKQFGSKLNWVLDTCPNSSIILSFREEFLSKISTIIGWSLQYYTYVALDYLNKEGVINAIQGATDSSIHEHFQNLIFEDSDLPLIIANDFFNLDKRVNTPLLQYVLRRMWDHVKKTTPKDQPIVFTLSVYENLKRDSLQELYLTA